MSSIRTRSLGDKALNDLDKQCNILYAAAKSSARIAWQKHIDSLAKQREALAKPVAGREPTAFGKLTRAKRVALMKYVTGQLPSVVYDPTKLAAHDPAYVQRGLETALRSPALETEITNIYWLVKHSKVLEEDLPTIIQESENPELLEFVEANLADYEFIHIDHYERKQKEKNEEEE